MDFGVSAFDDEADQEGKGIVKGQNRTEYHGLSPEYLLFKVVVQLGLHKVGIGQKRRRTSM
jgi:hypothetical protein